MRSVFEKEAAKEPPLFTLFSFWTSKGFHNINRAKRVEAKLLPPTNFCSLEHRTPLVVHRMRPCAELRTRTVANLNRNHSSGFKGQDKLLATFHRAFSLVTGLTDDRLIIEPAKRPRV